MEIFVLFTNAAGFLICSESENSVNASSSSFVYLKTLKMVVRVDIYLKTFCVWMNIMPQ